MSKQVRIVLIKETYKTGAGRDVVIYMGAWSLLARSRRGLTFRSLFARIIGRIQALWLILAFSPVSAEMAGLDSYPV